MGIHPFSMKMLSFVSVAMLVTGVAARAQTQTRPNTPQDAQAAQDNSPDIATSGLPQPETAVSDADAQSLADKDFLRKALEGGMAEVQFGQLAAQKASSDDVRSLGQKMVDDHTRLGNDLSQVAQGAGVTPPAGLSKKDKEMVAKLQQLSGSQFDNTYLAATVKDHKRDNDAFSLEAEKAAIPSVKRAAAQGQPVIAASLRMAEQIARAHNVK